MCCCGRSRRHRSSAACTGNSDAAGNISEGRSFEFAGGQKAVAVRKTGAAAKDLADMYFFETLVRVHRAGEGAPYTGLKPAGKIEPSIALADKSIETGKLEPVANALTERMHQGLHKQFEAVVAKKSYKPGDVAATRAYVQAYVPYVHYVERLYDAAATPAPVHGQESKQAVPAGHTH